LVTLGRFEEAKDIIRKMARYNGHPIPNNEIITFKEEKLFNPEKMGNDNCSDEVRISFVLCFLSR
jgi:hypothetical protein